MSRSGIFEGTVSDRKRQSQALLQASRSLNPYVSSDDFQVDDELEPLVEKIYDYVRKEAGLTSFDSVSDKIQARDVVTNMMSEVVLENADPAELDRRLGQKGILKQRRYKIEITDNLKEKGPSFGVRPSHVGKAIRDPDAVEHYNPMTDEDGGVSLFLEHHKNSADPFSLLVFARRKGDKIIANGAHRIYHSDVRAGKYITNPYEMLHEFAQTYGVPLTIGGETKKFFWLEQLPKPSKFARDQKLKVFGVRVPDNGTVTVQSLLRDDGDELYIGLAYAVYEDKYKNDLRKHDVTFYE